MHTAAHRSGTFLGARRSVCSLLVSDDGFGYAKHALTHENGLSCPTSSSLYQGRLPTRVVLLGYSYGMTGAVIRLFVASNVKWMIDDDGEIVCKTSNS